MTLNIEIQYEHENDMDKEIKELIENLKEIAIKPVTELWSGSNKLLHKYDPKMEKNAYISAKASLGAAILTTWIAMLAEPMDKKHRKELQIHLLESITKACALNLGILSPDNQP